MRRSRCRLVGSWSSVARAGTVCLLLAGVLALVPATTAAADSRAPAVPFAGHSLNQPVVAMTATPGGGGYWLVARDGGVFSYGDARFFGSTGALALKAPIVGMASTPDGGGYWLVASDGGIFSFGDAPFFGSMGGKHLDRPIVGMTATPGGHGYRFVATDGGVFDFGDAQYYGSLGGTGHPLVVGMAAAHDGNGYWMLTLSAEVVGYGDAVYRGQPGPAFSASIALLSAAQKASMVGVTWRPGCPIGLDSLRIITMPHWRFDGSASAGELVVNASAADAMVAAFHRMWDAEEPIDKMEPVERYGGNDDAADIANDTSAFNCRNTSSGTLSNHALGLAVDVNPLQNPYIHPDGRTMDPNAQRFANRSLQEAGVIHPGDAVWSAFAAVGWRWGGTVISPPDYQHFSPTGR
jgi:hypothetical protein